MMKVSPALTALLATLSCCTIVIAAEPKASPCEPPSPPSSYSSIIAALDKTDTAIGAIQLERTALSYVHAKGILAEIETAKKHTAFARQFIERLRASPSLLFYWHSFGSLTSASSALADLANAMPTTHNNDRTAEQAFIWQQGLWSAHSALEEAIMAFDEDGGRVLREADRCALDITYVEKKNATPR